MFALRPYFSISAETSVRKCMRIKRTPNDAGTKLTIEFTYYDNGFVSINGFAKGDYTLDEAERWLASTRFVMQMIEEFRNYINKSKTNAADKVQAKPLAVDGSAPSPSLFSVRGPRQRAQGRRGGLQATFRQ